MKNYKQFKDLELKFNRNRNILSGENGAGKSSILEVISYVLGASIRDIENKGLQTLFNVEIIKEYESKTKFVFHYQKTLFFLSTLVHRCHRKYEFLHGHN